MYSNINKDNINCLNEALWIDLIYPSKEEEQMVADALGVNIPTREAMQEIELSSRLYKKDGNFFMTAAMIAKSTPIYSDLQPVTFILKSEQLITLRYVELQAFTLFIEKIKSNDVDYYDSNITLIGLIEVAVDNLADTLEIVSYGLDEISKTIFPKDNLGVKKKNNYESIIQHIGFNADLNTKARESLVNFNRLVSFFAKSIDIIPKDLSKISIIKKDINALSDYANFISTKVNFLLDATLGMINIEQSNIIKIFSVAAVIFLPPSLMASIYGMNFKFMPELSYKYGYLIAIILMVFSAVIPYKFFKYKKWL